MSNDLYPVPSAVAIDPARLAWLCQPERREQTLRLLVTLSAWQRATERLLYDDRQGLAHLQTRVLAYATRAGIIQPIAFLDGTHHFPGGLLLDRAAEHAARALQVHLRYLARSENNPPFVPEDTRAYQHFIRPLLRRITGQDVPLVARAAQGLNVEQVRVFLQQRLDRLVARATRTRRPIHTRLLAALCFAPIDLLPVRDNRVYALDSYESWEDLAESDRRKLDPEGESRVAFASTSAAFVCHLPLRQAETFVPAERLRALRQAPGAGPERSGSAGGPVDEAESLAHPIREILRELGVEVARVCPHDLVDKQAYLARPAIRALVWPTVEQDPRAWADDPWDSLCLPPEER